MAVVFDIANAIETNYSNGYSSPITVNRPSTTGSDRYWFVFFSFDDGDAGLASVPAGWTAITKRASYVDGQCIFGAYIPFDSAGSSESFSISNAFWAGHVYSVVATGVSSVNATTGGSTGSSNAPIEMPAGTLTTTETGGLHVFVGVTDSPDSNAFSSFTPPSGFTSIYEYYSSRTQNLFIATKTLGATGSQGSVTGTVTLASSGSGGGAAVQLAIIEAGGGPSTLSVTASASPSLTGRSLAAATVSSAGVAAPSLQGRANALASLAVAAVAAVTGVGRSLASSLLSSNGIAAPSLIGGSYVRSILFAEAGAIENFISATDGSIWSSAGVGTPSFVGRALALGIITEASEASVDFTASSLYTALLSSQGVTSAAFEYIEAGALIFSSTGNSALQFEALSLYMANMEAITQPSVLFRNATVNDVWAIATPVVGAWTKNRPIRS